MKKHEQKIEKKLIGKIEKTWTKNWKKIHEKNEWKKIEQWEVKVKEKILKTWQKLYTGAYIRTRDSLIKIEKWEVKVEICFWEKKNEKKILRTWRSWRGSLPHSSSSGCVRVSPPVGRRASKSGRISSSQTGPHGVILRATRR